MNGREDRRGDREFARAHAFAGDEFVRDELQPRRRTLHEDDLHGVIVFEEDVLRADDLIDVGPLDLRERLEQARLRLVVKKGDGPRHEPVPLILIMLGETLVDHLRDRLRTVLESPRRDEPVELVKDRRRQRNADALHSFALGGIGFGHDW